VKKFMHFSGGVWFLSFRDLLCLLVVEEEFVLMGLEADAFGRNCLVIDCHGLQVQSRLKPSSTPGLGNTATTCRKQKI